MLCVFTYAAVTLYGRPFQTVRLTLSYPSFNQLKPHPPLPHGRGSVAPVNVCGPATPGFPCESPGLGCSDFARHYFRNHGCFLFLPVLRWFTSRGSLEHPMNSDARNGCSHPLGFPIRTSPDHRLLASPRGLSQLATSFIAYLRQGIHTHALSSLTIKFTLDIKNSPEFTYWPLTSAPRRIFSARRVQTYVAHQYSIVKELCL